MPRLDLLLARCAPVGRRRATALIRAGRVCALDGTPMRDAKVRIAPAELPRTVLLDGEPLRLREHAHLLQHKPAGCVTALTDPVHATAADYLGDAPLRAHLRAVGRLDKDTTGLLLWTTDGTLLHKLTHPRYGLPRTYQARLSGPFAPAPPDLTLRDGHRPAIVALAEIEPTQAHPGLLAAPDATVLAQITVIGGRFHEVRRIFAALGATVLALCRTSYGGLALPHDLSPGRHREADLPGLARDRHPAPA